MVVVSSKLYLPHSCGCGCYCCHVLIIAVIVVIIVFDVVAAAIVTVVVAVIRSRYGCRNYFVVIIIVEVIAIGYFFLEDLLVLCLTDSILT